jgi:hypothetical protein
MNLDCFFCEDTYPAEPITLVSKVIIAFAWIGLFWPIAVMIFFTFTAIFLLLLRRP